jgi:hypothetical protein
MNLSVHDLRSLCPWVAACAQRSLPLFEAKAPGDTRPSDAIKGILVFASGGNRTARLRTLALAALAAAREVKDPAARAAARSACQAAAAAYTHPLATIDQARHILASAVYTALAFEHSKNLAAGDTEIQWAIENASPEVREVLSRFPPQPPGRTRLAIRYYQLDAELRTDR